MKSVVHFGDEKIKSAFENLKDSKFEGWRLLYSVANSEVCIISIILEWMNHKEYERKFKY